MAEDKGMITEREISESESVPAPAPADVKKRQHGFFSRIWKGIFRVQGDDFEKRLQYISKEEATILSKMKKRSQTWRAMTRNLIIFSVIFEVIAIGYAIMTARLVDLDYKMRAFRILPMFLLPVLSSAAYSAFHGLSRMCDRRDENTLERLRAERQTKIDELKERTNYYTTQQLIQRYDTDPAAKAAAASVLASKLGADSGLKVYMGDESQRSFPTGKSNDFEYVQSSGLRNRKQLLTRAASTGSASLHHFTDELHISEGTESPQASAHNQLVVVSDPYPQGSTPHDGNWISRIAALLVGEDPTQSYALICGNCHMHNGLARKEEFPYITYYCPHCHVLNRTQQLDDRVSDSNQPDSGPFITEVHEEISNNVDEPVGENGDNVDNSESTTGDGLKIEELIENAT